MLCVAVLATRKFRSTIPANRTLFARGARYRLMDLAPGRKLLSLRHQPAKCSSKIQKHLAIQPQFQPAGPEESACLAIEQIRIQALPSSFYGCIGCPQS